MNEYLALVDEIKHHMNLYYNEDAPEISDAEYDALMRHLKEMEREHPEWVAEDSPTRIIGGTTKREAGVIVTHNVPMLSIEDVFTKDEVISWIREVLALHADAVFVVEQKIDGLSMSLRYEKGALVLAETRGDGLQGEDVTANARVIPDVVQRLKHDYAYLEVRGEVYMRHADFERTNAMQEAAGKKSFANPRNCAAGTLRQLDAAMVKERGLSFFAFNVQDASADCRALYMDSHTAGLKALAEECTLPVAPSYVCKTEAEVLAAIDAIGEARSDLPYDIDGAVIKIDQLAYREDFPAGSKYSAGHIAYKYPPAEKEAVIEAIELTVGMTGRINPTAVFTPIRLNGTTVSRATLHNQDFINELGVGIGATVLVYKSGEIIPKIRAVVRDKTPKDCAVFRIPDACPVCGGSVARGRSGAEGDDAADMYCTNDDCPAKLTRRIINFVGRDAMDMKGFGEEYIKVLIEEGYLKNIADLYTLKEHRDELVEKGLIGKEVNTDKLLQVIEDSKQKDPWRLLAGLSVPNVGKTSARTIMRHFKSFDALMAADVETLTQVEDIGEITAQGIVTYFASPAHREMMERLKDAGVMSVTVGTGTPVTFLFNAVDSLPPSEKCDIVPVPTVTPVFASRTYVITGDLNHFKNRDALIDYIEARGGKVAGSVSKKTYALINNDVASASGKNKKAKELGIPIVTEEEILAEGGPA